MNYPDRPTCHDADHQAQRFGPTVWRPKGEKLHPSNSLPMAYRTCSYCGSIHPEDLMDALQAGAVLEVADMKYGWPRKFYIHNIPNPYSGWLERVSTMGIKGTEPTEAEIARMGDGFVEVRVEQSDIGHGAVVHELAGYRVAPPTTHAKWYNEHLLDLDADSMIELADALYERVGIQFRMVDGKLMWAGRPK